MVQNCFVWFLQGFHLIDSPSFLSTCFLFFFLFFSFLFFPSPSFLLLFLSFSLFSSVSFLFFRLLFFPFLLLYLEMNVSMHLIQHTVLVLFRINDRLAVDDGVEAMRCNEALQHDGEHGNRMTTSDSSKLKQQQQQQQD